MSAATTIGWASRDITPDRPVSLRGLFNLRIATRVRDPLTLTALAIESGDEQTVFVSMDACAVNEEVLEAVREALRERLPEFDPDRLIASATHTHTAPFSGGGVGLQNEEDYLEEILAKYPDYMTIAEYTELVVEAMVSAVCEAWQSRSAGSLGWGYSYAVVGENRRVRYFDGRSQMYGSTSAPDFSHIEGHVDHSVNLLFTWDTDGNLTGMIVNVACPSQANEGGQDYISADYWHDVREEIRRRHGEGVFVLAQCSAAGDQTPHRLIGTRAEERMLKLKYDDTLNKSDNRGLRLDIARRVADAVDDAEPPARRDRRESVTLRHRLLRLDLPHWDVTDEQYEAVQQQMAEHRERLEELGDADRLSKEYTSLRSRIGWCMRAADRYEEPLESVPVEVGVVRIDDVAFVTAPFEYYLDFGDRIKGRSEAVQTFVVQLAGGGSYLATERAASGSSYGAVPSSCRVSPEGGEVIVDEAVTTISEMFAGR
ncbi:MAG: hypothetical protein ACOX9R_11115 [Armatimonadota bacterium]